MFSKFQNLTVKSFDPETRNFMFSISLLNMTHVTLSSWPSNLYHSRFYQQHNEIKLSFVKHSQLLSQFFSCEKATDEFTIYSSV